MLYNGHTFQAVNIQRVLPNASLWRKFSERTQKRKFIASGLRRNFCFFVISLEIKPKPSSEDNQENLDYTKLAHDRGKRLSGTQDVQFQSKVPQTNKSAIIIFSEFLDL